jgi:two-component system nitrogen regulation response regulator GlnG
VLVEHFLRHFGRGLGKQVRSVTPEAMRLLEAHDWRGNVRELESTIRYAVIHTTGDVLVPECLPEAVRGATAAVVPARTTPEAGAPDLADLVGSLLRTGEPDIYRKAALAADRVILGAVLQHTRGHLAQASELLGISRTTLRGKLRALGLAVEKQLLNDLDPRSESRGGEG